MALPSESTSHSKLHLSRFASDEVLPTRNMVVSPSKVMESSEDADMGFVKFIKNWLHLLGCFSNHGNSPAEACILDQFHPQNNLVGHAEGYGNNFSSNIEQLAGIPRGNKSSGREKSSAKA